MVAEPASPPASPEKNKFQLRRDQTRRELLRLGIERFPLKGYSSTTVEDIVHGSEYTRGAFYFHFKDKEEFFLELLRARAAVRGEWWLIAHDASRSTLEETLTGVFGLLSANESDGDVWLILIADFQQSTQQRIAYGDALRQLYADWVHEISLLLGILRDRGLIRHDREHASLAAELFASVEGHTLHSQLYGLQDPAGLLDSALRILRP